MKHRWLALEELALFARKAVDPTDAARIQRLCVEVFEMRGVIRKLVELLPDDCEPSMELLASLDLLVDA